MFRTNKPSVPRTSFSLPRYSRGGLGRGFARLMYIGAIDGRSTQPPPPPSPGVPGEGAERSTMPRALASLLILASTILTMGCQSQPRPNPGMASLRISVSAEPKAGRKDLPSHVAVYDSSAASARPQGDYELVDYS